MRLFWIVCLAALSQPVLAKELTIGMGNFEPYFNSQSKDGIFTEVVQKVFEKMPNYSAKMVFGLSNNELWLSYDKKLLDGVTNVFDFKPNSCLTDPVFRFQDVVVTKKSRNIKINNLEDIKGMSIVTYQGAKTFWGNHFASIVSTSDYVELNEPERQARLLIAGRADASIGDIFIFMNAVHKSEQANTSLKDFTIHHVFPQKYSYMAFRNIQICTEFNNALKELKESGEYELIYKRYLSMFSNKNH